MNHCRHLAGMALVLTAGLAGCGSAPIEAVGISDLGLTQKILTRSGAWFKYGETYLGQGKEKARAFLQENPQVTAELREKILASGALAGAVASDNDSGE